MTLQSVHSGDDLAIARTMTTGELRSASLRRACDCTGDRPGGRLIASTAHLWLHMRQRQSCGSSKARGSSSPARVASMM